MKKQIIVFGGTGFIGQGLIKKLAREGYSGLWTGVAANPPFASSQFQYHSKLSAAPLDPQTPTVAFYLTHIGPSGGTVTTEDQVAPFIQANENSMDEAFKAIRHLKVEHFVSISSGGVVYGKTEEKPIREDHELNPISTYGKIKKAGEAYLKKIAAKTPYTIIRPGNIFGPGQDNSLIPLMIQNIKNKEPIPVFGAKGTVRDFLDLDSFLEALVIAALSRGENETYNLASGKGTNTLDLIKITSRIMNAEGPTQIQFLPERGTDVPYNVLDISKFSRRFDWKPKISLESGLMRMLPLK